MVSAFFVQVPSVGLVTLGSLWIWPFVLLKVGMSGAQTTAVQCAPPLPTGLLRRINYTSHYVLALLRGALAECTFGVF